MDDDELFRSLLDGYESLKKDVFEIVNKFRIFILKEIMAFTFETYELL